MRTSDHVIDEWLVINSQQGDKKALALLVKRWDHKMIRRAFLTTNDQVASLDIAQEAWLTVIRKLHTLKDPGAFEWWSLKITTAKAIDWIRANQLHRKRNAIRELAQEEYMDDKEGVSEETLVALRVAIHQLPEEQLLVVQMFYHENLNILTISRILDVPSGTIKSRLFKARERLKKILKNKIIES